MAPPKTQAEQTPEGSSFDEQLERLEAIVGSLEEGGLGLEASIEQYREGVQLLSACRELLVGFQRQVEELTSSNQVQPFDGDPDMESDSGCDDNR